jgi:uncharacterized protein YecT (DUF1311 family)
MRIHNHTIFVIIFTIILLTYSSAGITANGQKKDPIDEWVEEQIAKDPSTAGEIHAYDKGSEMWNKDVNRIYKELMKRLDKHQQTALKEAQRNWIKYRDAEYQAIGQIIQRLEGTMWLPVPSARLYKINRQRAMELKDYLDWMH